MAISLHHRHCDLPLANTLKTHLSNPQWCKIPHLNFDIGGKMIIFQIFLYLIASAILGFGAKKVEWLVVPLLIICSTFGLIMGYMVIGIVDPMFGGIIAPLSIIAIGVIGFLCGYFFSYK